MKYVTTTKFYPDQTEPHKRKSKPKKMDDRRFHIFFDIDSTLTHTGIKTINRDVKDQFEKFKKHDCRIYFCTGRAMQEVYALNEKYDLGFYGIAEAGGILLGDMHAGMNYRLLGKRTEPDTLVSYMKKTHIPFHEDPNQSNRLSEVVLLKKSIGVRSLNSAIKKSGAKVNYYRTKNTIHVTARGVNKGAAIEFLTSNVLRIGSNTDKVIGVGDSELDLKMFEYCNESYAVGRDETVRKKATYKLRRPAPYAITELYGKLFPF